MPFVMALVLLAPASIGCGVPPVAGPISAPFAPGSGYAGHWGVDFSAPPETAVVAVLPGVVSFAGLVIDNLAVTIDHGGGMRTSYSYLQRVAVRVGELVRGGELVGRSGWAHGRSGLHLSLRLGDRYLDPMRVLGCPGPPGPALRLVSSPPPARL